MKTKRQREVDARRAQQLKARNDHMDGYRAAMAGQPLPPDASRAFVIGYNDGIATKEPAR